MNMFVRTYCNMYVIHRAKLKSAKYIRHIGKLEMCHMLVLGKYALKGVYFCWMNRQGKYFQAQDATVWSLDHSWPV